MMRRFTLFFPAAFLTLILFQFAPNDLRAFDKTGCEMDCQKCHTITNEDVREILKNLKAPEAEILKVQASPMKGLWEVSIMNKGRPGLFYVDFSKNFVVSGSIVEVKTGKNVTMEKVTQLQQSRRVDFSKIPLGQALVMGDVASPRKVAVFTDPD
jgi:thiol:disulfide interchange protein DsbC